MASNIEIKARVRDWKDTCGRAEAISGGSPEIIKQHDTFYRAPRGRLKLRRFASGTGELIYYERPDEAGPKASKYDIDPVSDVELMNEVLCATLGAIGDVRKVRRLYMSGRTRIHLDEVEELGRFLELEVVLEPGEDPAAGEAEARGLLVQLRIEETDLVSGAYIDLLEQRENQ